MPLEYQKILLVKEPEGQNGAIEGGGGAGGGGGDWVYLQSVSKALYFTHQNVCYRDFTCRGDFCDNFVPQPYFSGKKEQKSRNSWY